MPYRLILAPAVLTPFGARTSLVDQFTLPADPDADLQYLFVDPARGLKYNTVNYLSALNRFLVLVAGQDFTPITASADLHDLFATSFTAAQRTVIGTLRLRDIPGMNQGVVNSLKNRLTVDIVGVSFADVTLDTTIDQLGQRIQMDPNFKVENNWVSDT